MDLHLVAINQIPTPVSIVASKVHLLALNKTRSYTQLSTTATDTEVLMIPCPQCLQASYCTPECAKADYSKPLAPLRFHREQSSTPISEP